MYYRRKSLEDLPEENTAIWSCSKEGCNGWMRDNFAFEYVPTCHQCNSLMESSVKMLPLLVNTNRDLKSIKKGVQIL
ncbi:MULTISPECIES: cold-shock protein [Paenibacillus]|uniref:Cold-shock protein n=1 Tax=Paenibacillus radicis (ex Xue et al. 2023) TaxID=2972489 RepID=A0ABT1YKN8_9BACL|nr:cold-shock protein [Paenibacillus radicis (ex Xue et al. 2023)]MCR8633753.1 cold-shock protein [Paenibacillus radicis (ex Xue et al. 2023)]